jgi:Protein of unknown function (DUF1616)
MGSLDAAEAVAGLALVFVLPGFALSRALFPEWRFRGPGGTVRVVETLSFSLVGSVGITIVIGYGLLSTSVGFGATWADPTIFAALAAVTAVGLVVAFLRGAFSAVPPAGPVLPAEPGVDGAMEAVRELDRLRVEERRLRHQLRTLAREAPERTAISEQLEENRRTAASIVARREEQQNAG